MDADRKNYRARWVFPVEGPPINNGVVEVVGDQIVSVRAGAVDEGEYLGHVALIPGLVNAHTHLEFGGLKQPIEPAQPFTAWIRALVTRRNSVGFSTADGIEQGYRECGSSGTTLVGEIATAGSSFDRLGGAGAQVVAFRELLGLSKGQVDEQLTAAREFLDDAESGRIVRGLSPHAPYSVHPELYRRLIELAAQRRAPVAIHLAETRAELELLNSGTGEFVPMLQEFGVWSDDAIPRGSRPLDYLRPLADLERALVIHGNYLAEDEIDFLAAHPHVTVIYCPRTHAWFGHEPHPWLTMLKRGVSVALGTDSRASNPDLSLWDELLFLREQFGEVPPETLLRLGTSAGAQALGRGEDRGKLAPGQRADMVLVAIDSLDEDNPHAALFDWRSRVVATMHDGEWISAE
ncbi:MAG: chlorohydrolase [Planctomycetaceae bacterium]|nr:chlorohydrolase [Planctomycetaceae bacterium]